MAAALDLAELGCADAELIKGPTDEEALFV